jgi:16S rRNA (cytosine967-C5)-methyltransferase
MLDALQRVLDGALLEDVLPDVLKDLREPERGIVARRLIGTSVLRMRLAHLTSPERRQQAAALHDAYVRYEEEGAPVDDSAWPMSIRRSCPQWLCDVLIDSLGEKVADEFLAASNKPGPKTLRANGARDDVARALRDEGIATTEGRHSPWALHVEGKANLFGSRAWRNGMFEVQDEGSQLIALATEAKPGDVVVDLCAGRGGKTLALASMMENRGRIHVHDVDANALKDMKPRLARAKVTCVVEGLPEEGTADVVLVDAPCSSLGTLRRSPDLRWHITQRDLARWPPIQRALLEDARKLVKSQGRIVYATCTVLRAENEDIAGKGRLLLPNVDGTDGFFVSILC